MRKQFARTFDSLEEIFGFAEEFFASERIDERHRFAVNFALEEIFTNMVKYNQGSEREIRIDLDRADNRLRVTLTDFDVEPFDITHATETPVDVPLEERTAGGLGLQLTKKMMDEVDYEYADRQSTITLTKLLE